MRKVILFYFVKITSSAVEGCGVRVSTQFSMMDVKFKG